MKKNRLILKEDKKHRDLLNELFYKGIIDEDGKFVELKDINLFISLKCH